MASSYRFKEIKPFRNFEPSREIKEEFCPLGGIDIDDHLNIYITDLSKKRILIYSYDGDYITSLKHDFIISLFSIALHEYCIVVTDLARGYIVKFDSEYCPIVTKSQPRILKFASGLSIDENGETFVADCGNDRVAIFDNNLKLKRSIGSGKLTNPRDVKFCWNEVYVSDSNKLSHIHVFTKSGDLLRSLIARDATGNLFICINKLNETIVLSNANCCEILACTIKGEILPQYLDIRGRPTGCIELQRDRLSRCFSEVRIRLDRKEAQLSGQFEYKLNKSRTHNKSLAADKNQLEYTLEVIQAS
ncbi:Outer membrane phospholipase A [Oopsacas minuta]|uniref:Outer membrane phospholipase A n=1 Tax=Oopsacas minuta TaxID=111878 RepID=A0AAV7KIZ2_9METZ|nr:Outer membrane phospholipase A [Oopsacas minuta]